MSITYLMGSGTGSFPAYIVGPVAHSAERVSVEFQDGTRIQLSTTPTNDKLNDIRFYATTVPARLVGQPARLTGFDHRGSVVACLVPRTAVDGVSSLSDCR
jgi:hypothetical protein